jgi:hypothetical protein
MRASEPAPAPVSFVAFVRFVRFTSIWSAAHRSRSLHLIVRRQRVRYECARAYPGIHQGIQRQGRVRDADVLR